MSEQSKTRFRPYVVARLPAIGDMKSAQSEVDAVMSDLSSVVRGREERSLWMETRVEDITPVSSRDCQ